MTTSISRLSCTPCRQKKLKCDRVLPQCGRCARAGEECSFPTGRKVNKGKRKQVRELEEKLFQLEGRIQTLSAGEATLSQETGTFTGTATFSRSPALDDNGGGVGIVEPQGEGQPPSQDVADEDHDEHSPTVVASTELLEELTAIYFDKLSHATPMIQRSRYLSSLRLPPGSQPPACLQHMISATGASIIPTHASLAASLYKRGRALAEEDEMRDQQDLPIGVGHVQSWLLIANFEAINANFSRACVSLGRAIRMAQMLNLHQLDRGNNNPPSIFPTTIQPPQDWIKLEERRRTWWVAYVSDRVVFATSGIPALIDDQDIFTLLPVSEEAFQDGSPEPTTTLRDAMRKIDTTPSTFGARVMAASLFYQASKTAPQPNSDNPDDDEYCQRLQGIDHGLSALTDMLPANLQLPENAECQHAIFVNILIHTATMCLHKTAAQKAKCLQGPEAELLARESHNRMFAAAVKVLDVFQHTRDLVMALKNPIQDYTAYIAALVFLQDFSVGRSEQSRCDTLFLFGILRTAGEIHAVAHMLSAQLGAQLENCGIEIPRDDEIDLESLESYRTRRNRG
ncbi:hypothetical protein CDV31_000106 [Fusarium ambrosium]|uniref:Zn(2)-C6 fungal-type domain-containing protein n=1 Tax=Fusarium ambrosium TaxID=131363 RepID=A0A428V3G3_9HYPO|nr:hypothetical protein CDV31_000106 [Fusarium ambrosium]